MGEINLTASAGLDNVKIQYSVINEDEVELRITPRGRRGISHISLFGAEGDIENLITISSQALIALRVTRANEELERER